MVCFVVFFCTNVTRCHGLVGFGVGLFLYDFDCVFGVRGWVVGGCGLKVPSKN